MDQLYIFHVPDFGTQVQLRDERINSQYTYTCMGIFLIVIHQVSCMFITLLTLMSAPTQVPCS